MYLIHQLRDIKTVPGELLSSYFSLHSTKKIGDKELLSTSSASPNAKDTISANSELSTRRPPPRQPPMGHAVEGLFVPEAA